MNFTNKIVLITGAASGIGKAAAIEFAKLNATLALADWNEKGGQETLGLVKSYGAKAMFCQLDVSSFEAVRDFVDRTATSFGQIDIALNNAGIGAKNTFKTAEHTLEDWENVIAVNQTGVFYCMREELRHMTPNKSGCIINVASIAGLRGLPNQLAYVASKHAVIGMTKTAALEYAKYGIRVNSVCPVFTNSPMLEMLFDSKEGLREKLVRSIPVGRYGEVSDIVNAIIWLAQGNSSFVTGLNLPIDGGQLA